MSALDNIHYGFGHHYKWQSPQIVSYLSISGAISDTANITCLVPN